MGPTADRSCRYSGESGYVCHSVAVCYIYRKDTDMCCLQITCEGRNIIPRGVDTDMHRVGSCYCEVGFTTRLLNGTQLAPHASWLHLIIPLLFIDHVITFTREANEAMGCNTFE